MSVFKQLIFFSTIAILNLISRYELKHTLTHYLLIPSHDMNYFFIMFQENIWKIVSMMNDEGGTNHKSTCIW